MVPVDASTAEIIHHEIDQPAMRDRQYRPCPFCDPDIGIDNPVADIGPARGFPSGPIIPDGRWWQPLGRWLADNEKPVAARRRTRRVINALRIGKHLVAGSAVHHHKLR